MGVLAKGKCSNCGYKTRNIKIGSGQGYTSEDQIAVCNPCERVSIVKGKKKKCSKCKGEIVQPDMDRVRDVLYSRRKFRITCPKCKNGKMVFDTCGKWD